MFHHFHCKCPFFCFLYFYLLEHKPRVANFKIIYIFFIKTLFRIHGDICLNINDQLVLTIFFLIFSISLRVFTTASGSKTKTKRRHFYLLAVQFFYLNFYRFRPFSVYTIFIITLLQRGSILEHFKECHNIKPTKQQLSDNTTILDHAPDRYRLFIKEALHIIKHNPSINKQYDNFTNVLKLYTHRNCIDRRPSLIYPTTPIRSQLSPPSQNSLIIDNSPILRHNVSPQIIGRINNLVNGERTVPSTPQPYSPIAYRLRSHTLQSSQ